MSEHNLLAADEWPETLTLDSPVPLPDVRDDDFDSGSEAKLLQWDLERSPRLNADPKAKLNTYEEVSWYRSRLAQIGVDSEYLHAIDEIIFNDPVLREISPDTRVLACVPVAATSEYDSIYGALSLYVQQDADILQDTTVLVHANWTESAAADPEKAALIVRTLAEIERAKQDFSQLRIASFTSQFEDAFIEERGGIVGEAVRRLLDVELMTVLRMKQNGQTHEQDVIAVRNDGDGMGMSRHYLKRIVDAADANPNVDAFTGVVRWDTKTHADYPGFGVVTNFREIMHAATALSAVDVPVMTVGINSAIRSSTLAAIGCLGRGKYIGVGSDDREMGMRVIDARRKTHASAPIASLALGESVERPIMYVSGAGIDTAADRLLTAYRRQLPITAAWDNFDTNGHTDRRANMNGNDLIPAETIVDAEDMVSRIELSINGMINIWFRSPSHLRMGLALTFSERLADDAEIYSLSQESNRLTFTFTEGGKEWLLRRLTRSTPDIAAYGQNIVRQLYEHSDGLPSRYVSTLA